MSANKRIEQVVEVLDHSQQKEWVASYINELFGTDQSKVLECYIISRYS